MDDIADVADLLRDAREQALMSQDDLSQRSGVSQSTIAALERRQRLPRLDVLVKLLAAMDLQLHVELEPLFRDLDARIDVLTAMSPQERLAEAGNAEVLPGLVLMHMAGTGAVLSGALAAIAHGAPVPLPHLEFVVPGREDVLTRVERALQAVFAWHPEVGHAAPGALSDPDVGDASRWRTGSGDICVRRVDDDVPVGLTVAIQTREGLRSLPVMSLWRIEATDRVTQRVLTRMRARVAGAAGQGAARAASNAS
ncbi:MAG: helix-turn-helix domain-containing protein [Actinomycetes bacterium]